MRQVGGLAAAAILSLENRSRLADDHARAARLASAVANLPDVRFDPTTVESNIVIFDVPDASAFVERLKGDGVLAAGISKTAVRLVTHLDVDDAGIDRAIEALRRAAGAETRSASS